jgi:hypothetical protein
MPMPLYRIVTVSECDAGVPAKPTPTPMKMYATAISQYELPSFHRRSIARRRVAATRSRTEA